MIILVIRGITRTRVKRHIFRRPDRKSILSTRRVEGIRVTNKVIRNSIQVQNDQVIGKRKYQIYNHQDRFQAQDNRKLNNQDNNKLLHLHNDQLNNQCNGYQDNNEKVLQYGQVRANHSSNGARFITVNVVRDGAPSSLNLKIGNLTRGLNNNKDFLRLRVDQTNGISRHTINALSTLLGRQKTSNSFNNLNNTIFTPHKAGTGRHDADTAGGKIRIKRVSIGMKVRQGRINSTLRTNRRYNVNHLRNFSSTSKAIKGLGRTVIQSSSRHISFLTRIISTMFNKDKALEAFRTRQADSGHSNRDALLVDHADSSQTNTDANTAALATNSRRRINALRKFLSVELVVLYNLDALFQIHTDTRSTTKLVKRKSFRINIKTRGVLHVNVCHRGFGVLRSLNGRTVSNVATNATSTSGLSINLIIRLVLHSLTRI